MKRSSLITIIILIALAVASVFVFKSKHKTSTLDKEASNFKILDTASIDKVFIADKDGNKVLLERKNGEWLVDGKYKARFDMIDILLYTIRMVEVKSPVAKSAKPAVIRLMTSRSTKVEIYSKGEKIKQYYIGHTTQDHTGTYMILTDLDSEQNYEDPFITHIPGFEGFLSTRYNTSAIEWRDRQVFNYRVPQIKQIKLDLHEMPDSSFTIDLFSMQRFGLKNGKAQQLQFAEDKLKQYIAYFQNVHCEYFLEDNSHVTDSLKKSALPFATLTITDRNNQSTSCDFYHKQPVSSNNELYKKEYKYDPDRMFIKFNNGKDYAVGQFYVFGKILQSYSYFLKGY